MDAFGTYPFVEVVLFWKFRLSPLLEVLLQIVALISLIFLAFSGVAEAALPTSSAGPVKGATTGPSSPSDADLSKSKTAVLDCIREERPHLKKTVTNDRSAPKLH